MAKVQKNARGKRMSRRHRGDFDASTIGAALARPGMDTRQWISYGLVDAPVTVDGEVIDPVQFDEDMGGPLVNVTLHSSGVPVRCRIAAFNSGNGEGEYVPFVEGDEVVVAIPGGDERADPIIIGRPMGNVRDQFPFESVAGQDPTGNKFSFRRIRTPRIEEYADSYMVRSASSGAFFLMSQEGNVTIRDGSEGALQMTPDIFGYQSADGTQLIQLDKTNGRITLMVGDAIVNLADSSNPDDPTSSLSTNSSYAVGTLSNLPAEHVVSTEALCNLLNQLFIAIAVPFAAIGAAPVTGTAAAGIFGTVGTVELVAALAAAATAPVPGTLASAIVGAFAAQPPKQTPVTPATGQVAPGVGSKGHLTG